MMLTLATLLLTAVQDGGGVFALRVKRAETIAQGPLEHALILVEGGKIVEIGEDLPVERGIPVYEFTDWVATPGLVNCHTRIGSERGIVARAFEPQATPELEIDPKSDVWEELLELGVTTLGYYPEGSGIPGQAFALQPYGKTLAEMLVLEPAYLKVVLQSSASSKNMLREAFQKADEYEEKVKKEREKWEKEQEKKKSKSKSKKDDEKKDEAKEKESEKKDDEKKEGASSPAAEDGDKKADDKPGADVFVPPEPDERVRPFLELRKQTLTAMMSLRKAADYLHLLDVIEKEEDVEWFVQFPLQDDIDFFEVAAKMGEKKLLAVTQPELTLQPNSLRERNIPAELARAGVKVAFVPRQDTVSGHEDWLPDVGRLVGQGLPRDAALAGLTLEPARALGLEERLGSLEKEKDANIVLWSGDPLEPSSRVQAVLLAGKFVVGSPNERARSREDK